MDFAFLHFSPLCLHGYLERLELLNAVKRTFLPKTVSQVSSHGSRSTTVSVRVREEAERAAILAKIDALKEKHALEEKENALQRELQALKRRREAHELKTNLAATSSRLAILSLADDWQQEVEMARSRTAKPSSKEHLPYPAAETQAAKPVDENLQREGTDAMNAYLDEMSMKSVATEVEFLSLDKFSKAFSLMKIPSVRPKDGVHFQPILEMDGRGGKKTSTVQASSPLEPLRESSSPSPKTTSKASGQLLTRSSLNDDGLANILQRQNDITSILVEQQKQSTLPQREISIFSGDVLSYRPFIRAFEHIIEKKTDSSADRLYFLDQYTSGLPRDLVRSCLHMSSETGYEKAKALLQEHYGDEFKSHSHHSHRKAAN